MEEMKCDKTRRDYTLIGVLGITALALLILFLSMASTATAQSALPAGTYAYITNSGDNTVSVIDTAINTVTATVPVEEQPKGVAVSPDGARVYITNYGSNTVSVIDTATNTVTSTVPVGTNPEGVAASPDGTKVYVANLADWTVSVIDTCNKYCYSHGACRKLSLWNCSHSRWIKSICDEPGKQHCFCD